MYIYIYNIILTPLGVAFGAAICYLHGLNSYEVRQRSCFPIILTSLVNLFKRGFTANWMFCSHDILADMKLMTLTNLF